MFGLAFLHGRRGLGATASFAFIFILVPIFLALTIAGNARAR